MWVLSLQMERWATTLRLYDKVALLREPRHQYEAKSDIPIKCHVAPVKFQPVLPKPSAVILVTRGRSCPTFISFLLESPRLWLRLKDNRERGELRIRDNIPALLPPPSPALSSSTSYASPRLGSWVGGCLTPVPCLPSFSHITLLASLIRTFRKFISLEKWVYSASSSLGKSN